MLVEPTKPQHPNPRILFQSQALENIFHDGLLKGFIAGKKTNQQKRASSDPHVHHVVLILPPPFTSPPPPQIWFRPLIRPYSESPTFNRASHVNGNQVTRNNPFVTTPEIWHVPWKGTLFKKDMHYNPTINFQLGDVSLVQGNMCLSSHCFGTPSFIQFCHPTRGHHLLGVTGFRHTRYQLQFEVATETSEWSSLSYQHFKGDSRGTPNKGTPIW